MNAAVEIDNLAKVFGGLRAVDGVTLRVAPGERRALIGPNGAGKTTLFHCVTGTLRASSGHVRLFGHDVTHLPEYRRTELGMGRTFRITYVFTDLSLIENLALSIAVLTSSSALAGYPYPGWDHDTLGECYDYVINQYNDNGDDEGLEFGMDNCDDSYAEMASTGGGLIILAPTSLSDSSGGAAVPVRRQLR